MPTAAHPLAPHYLPSYLAGPDGSDSLLTVVVVLLVLGLMLVGNLYLKLHSVPERLAHKHNHMQLQIITVLGLLALFTHDNIFWIAALLLAVVRLPDFMTPIKSIAKSLEQLAAKSMEDEQVKAGAEAPPAAEKEED
ncbi:MAG: hypothetical protein ACI9B9_000553 [Halioglobus sp.]|jgi:hypothetical protein